MLTVLQEDGLLTFPLLAVHVEDVSVVCSLLRVFSQKITMNKSEHIRTHHLSYVDQYERMGEKKEGISDFAYRTLYIYFSAPFTGNLNMHEIQCIAIHLMKFWM